ncbi:uncharacterized protein LOC142331981 [Lycorma delicatula]|uniref:uncharacterized protein LOC142331981 n=1 Tax=Lycorma delicatula TaxID=130591 RepID=UPI003F50DC14
MHDSYKAHVQSQGHQTAMESAKSFTEAFTGTSEHPTSPVFTKINKKHKKKSVITEPFNEQKFLENCSTNGESRSLKNLQFPFLYFEESCAELYEECAKRKKVFEEALTPKKKVMKEEKLTDVKTTVKPETSKSKKANEIIYDEEEESDDETYFPIGKTEVKPVIKTEEKKSLAFKKKRRLKNL